MIVTAVIPDEILDQTPIVTLLYQEMDELVLNHNVLSAMEINFPTEYVCAADGHTLLEVEWHQLISGEWGYTLNPLP